MFCGYFGGSWSPQKIGSYPRFECGEPNPWLQLTNSSIEPFETQLVNNHHRAPNAFLQMAPAQIYVARDDLEIYRCPFERGLSKHLSLRLRNHFRTHWHSWQEHGEIQPSGSPRIRVTMSDHTFLRNIEHRRRSSLWAKVIGTHRCDDTIHALDAVSEPDSNSNYGRRDSLKNMISSRDREWTKYASSSPRVGPMKRRGGASISRKNKVH